MGQSGNGKWERGVRVSIQYRLWDYQFDFSSFGHMVRARREDADFTQEGVAQLLEVSESHVSTIERGVCKTMTVKSMLRLCNLFDLDPRNYWYIDGE